MRRVLGALAAFQFLDGELHVVRAFPRRDEEGVARLDDHQVLYADRGDEAAFAAQVRAVAVARQDIALRDVAERVLGPERPQRAPRADIAPAEAGGNHRGVARLRSEERRVGKEW